MTASAVGGDDGACVVVEGKGSSACGESSNNIVDAAACCAGKSGDNLSKPPSKHIMEVSYTRSFVVFCARTFFLSCIQSCPLTLNVFYLFFPVVSSVYAATG